MDKSNVYIKLMKVQSELKAPKNQYNSFGKYNYRSCEDILEGLKPLLVANKAIVTIRDDMELVGDRYYIRATVTFIDAETGDKLEASALAREEENKKGMDGSQITGTASSYARKYALNGLFCIDDTKDADSTNTHGKEDKSKLINPDKTFAGPEFCSNTNCKVEITEPKVVEYSKKYFGGKVYCKPCQDKIREHQKQKAKEAQSA